MRRTPAAPVVRRALLAVCLSSLLLLIALFALLPTARAQDDIDLLKQLGDAERQKQEQEANKVGPPLTERQIAQHVLDRLAFGAKPGEVDEVVKMGWKNWVNAQLKPYLIDDSQVEQLIASRYPSMTMDMTEVYAEYRPPYRNRPPSDGEQARRQQLLEKCMAELQHAVFVRAAMSERRLQEVILEFWRNHFNVDQTKDSCNYVTNHYEQTLRKYAFGKFEDLLLATAKHPAMLVYLDNALSRRDLTDAERQRLRGFGRYNNQTALEKLARQRGLNENYARELMELHTLGVDNGYTEKDVIALARVLTGWSVGMREDETYGFVFYRDRHDPYPKRLMKKPVLPGGVDEGKKVIKMLANDERTARFIAAKLCRYLVSDKPSKELIERAAQSFIKSEGDLPSVYATIIFHDEFISPVNYRAKFKTPFEFTVSALRAVDANVSSARSTLAALDVMGQTIYQCQDPTGYDDRAEAWLDPGVLVHRWEYALRLADGAMPGVSVGRSFEKRHLAESAEDAMDGLIEAVLPNGVDDHTRSIIARDADTANRVLGMLLGSPAFQQQ